MGSPMGSPILAVLVPLIGSLDHQTKTFNSFNSFRPFLPEVVGPILSLLKAVNPSNEWRVALWSGKAVENEVSNENKAD